LAENSLFAGLTN